MKKSEKMPDGFLWGAATSAHQVEGGNHNDWTEWEQVSAKRKAQNAKLRKLPEYILEGYPSPLQEENYISGRACDHYNRYEEDFDIAKQLGHTAYRFSIEWSRVEPEEGKFDEREIEHYRAVIQALRMRGMEPFVTLWHWTNPTWVSDQGGWENEITITHFLYYVEHVIKKLGTDVAFWIPFNEPETYIGMSYIQGVFPPQKRSIFVANRVFKNMMTAHKQAYQLIKSWKPDANVGTSHYAVYMDSATPSWLNRKFLSLLFYVRSGCFWNALQGHRDFFGLQYYHHDRVRFKFGGRWGIVGIENKNEWASDMGWEIYPAGLYHLLKEVSKYNVPIYITENGIADARDIHRAEFIRKHAHAVQKALNEGVDVRGYFYWSLLDNFEWDKGFWPRFGLVEVDYKTQERKIRPSAWAYKKIIEEGL